MVGKWASIGHIQPRFFGSSLTLPWASWMESCKLEPNLGIHDYYQAKTQEKLKGKQWLCFGENLVISDQDVKNVVHSKGTYYMVIVISKKVKKYRNIEMYVNTK